MWLWKKELKYENFTDDVCKLIILPLYGVRIKINYTKSSSECCTFNVVQIKTRLLMLRSEQSLESGKTRDGHCSGWKIIPIIYSPWIE
jgi:hypothetical protein